MPGSDSNRSKGLRMTVEVSATSANETGKDAPRADDEQYVSVPAPKHPGTSAPAPARSTSAPAPKVTIDAGETPEPAARPQAAESQPVRPQATEQPRRTVVEGPGDAAASSAAGDTAPEQPTGRQTSSQSADAQGSAQQQRSGMTFREARQAAAGWVHRTFPGHEYAFMGAMLALVLAGLVFAIGIVRVLFICVLVVVGIAVGQLFDGDPKIIRAVRNLFSNDQGQR